GLAAAARPGKTRTSPPRSRKCRRIRLTDWRENMPNRLQHTLASDGFSEPLYLRLLGKLASSLDSSRQAVLSGDVGQLEQLTAEQAVLWARILPLAEADHKRCRNDGVQAEAGRA